MIGSVVVDYLHQPGIVCKQQMLGFQRVDFAINVQVESYDSKYLSRRSWVIVLEVESTSR